MPLIGVILVLIVVGLLLWLVTTYIPMNDMIKRIIIVVVIFAVVIWLLQVFGLWSYITEVKTPRV